MAIMIAKNVGMALHTMRSSRGRSFLTMLGVIIAVAAVTSIVSIGNGIKQTVTEQTNQYSKNVLTIRPSQIGDSGSAFTAGGPTAAASLTQKDVNTVSKVAHVSASVPLTVVAGGAKGDNSFAGVVYGVSTDLPTVVNQELAFGAYFTTHESSTNLAVIGSTAADKMFDERVPLGRSFTIRGQQFIVSGVLSKFASTPFSGSANFNNAIFISDSAASELLPDGAPIYEVLAKVSEGEDIRDVDTAIDKALAKAHGGQHDFAVLTPAELAQTSTSSFDLLAALTVAAAVITLLVSGVGIMNVMLVSVTERVHEIGIRKAVGATNRQILHQFVTEATTLCVVGSVIGAGLALVACVLIHLYSSITPQYDWRTAGLSCLAAIAFGVLFGSLPALKAARKDPIAALRNE